MEKTVVVTLKLRGTESEIETIKTGIASLSVCEEVISMYIKEEKNE